MIQFLTTIVNGVNSRYTAALKPDDNEIKVHEYTAKLKGAWDEWQKAQLYFDSVSDPDLVDVAIFDLEAAERKYFYLLKEARAMNMQIK